MERLIITGNANAEAPKRKGWFIGQFMDSSEPLRTTRDVEVKWGVHDAGEARDTWSLNKSSTTLTILISGKISHEFPSDTVLLRTPGDYVVWAPGVPHRWMATEPSVSVSIRWPSIPHDTVELTSPLRPERIQADPPPSNDL